MVENLEQTPAGQVVIQPAGWRDLNAVRSLEKVCFPKDAWPLLDLVGVLTLPNVVRLKAELEGALIGFIAGDVRPSEKVAWIATIGVLPEYRRRGIGKALLQACERQLGVPRVRLCVRAANQEAIQLYLNEGYRKTEIWAKYYQDGEDALVMEKAL